MARLMNVLQLLGVAIVGGLCMLGILCVASLIISHPTTADLLLYVGLFIVGAVLFTMMFVVGRRYGKVK